jgi:hypothetical protein
LVLKKQTICSLRDLKKIYGGKCSFNEIPSATCCCWTDSCGP